MKKLYFLKTCDSCRKMMAQLPLQGVELREIKSNPLDAAELAILAEAAGSYEVIFSRNSRKYREYALHERSLSEKDYQHYLLEDYTFLKRPLLMIAGKVFCGSNQTVLESMKSALT